MGTKINRVMKLSYTLPIETILERIKQDIIQVQTDRSSCTERIVIKTEVYS